MTAASRFAVALAAVLAAPASAAPWTTPPAYISGSYQIFCSVQNVGTKTRTVSARVISETGALLDEGSEDVVPGQVRELASTSADTAGAYCVFEGASKQVRGFLRLRDDAVSQLVLPATR